MSLYTVYTYIYICIKLDRSTKPKPAETRPSQNPFRPPCHRQIPEFECPGLDDLLPSLASPVQVGDLLIPPMHRILSISRYKHSTCCLCMSLCILTGSFLKSDVHLFNYLHQFQVSAYSFTYSSYSLHLSVFICLLVYGNVQILVKNTCVSICLSHFSSLSLNFQGNYSSSPKTESLSAAWHHQPSPDERLPWVAQPYQGNPIPREASPRPGGLQAARRKNFNPIPIPV